MIVISKTDANTFGEQDAPTGIYQPIPINGGLFVVPDEAESIVDGLGLNKTKRAIAQNEWIIYEL